MTISDIIAKTIANTPITDKYLSLSIFSISTVGANNKDTMTMINSYDA